MCLGLYGQIFGQNMIINPGFEEYSDVFPDLLYPPQFDGLSTADIPEPWKQRLSCDTYVDNPDIIQFITATNAPLSGYGCIGFAATTSQHPLPYRECPIAKTDVLTAGQEYMLKYFVKRRRPRPNDVPNIATMHIGAYFTTEDLSCFANTGSTTLCPLLTVSPQVEGTTASGEYEYVMVVGNWTAPTSASYNIVIGNYRDSAVQGLEEHYFYLDDAELMPCNSTANSTPIINLGSEFCGNSAIIANASASANVQSYRWSVQHQNGTVLREFTQWESGSPTTVDVRALYPLMEGGNCYTLILETIGECRISQTTTTFCIEDPDFAIEPLIFPICEGADISLIANEGESDWLYTWGHPLDPEAYGSGVGLSSVQVPADLNINKYTVLIETPTGCLAFVESNEIVVHPNNNEPPSTTGINGNGEFVAYAQISEEICFDIPTFDNPDENVFISINSSIPNGATFNPNADLQQVGTFCWTPGATDSGYHDFEVTIRDENICYSEQSDFTFTIKVICDHCPIEVFFENRQPAPDGFPLPPLTVAGQRITAGIDVDPTQTNGTVETGDDVVIFRAPQVITIEPGFVGGEGFEAIIDPDTCIDDCEDCCENWDGFHYDTPFVPFVVRNADVPYWYLEDALHPYCAFGATGYTLKIWGVSNHLVYEVDYDSPTCCPFNAPAPELPIPISNIAWNGRGNVGQYDGEDVPSGHGYGAILTLRGCGHEESLHFTISVFDNFTPPSGLALSDEIIEAASTQSLNAEQRNILNSILEDQKNGVSQISVFPNPTSDYVQIEGLKGQSTIQILTMDGKLVKVKNSSDNSVRLSLNELSAGVYVTKIVSSRGKHEELIIKE